MSNLNFFLPGMNLSIVLLIVVDILLFVVVVVYVLLMNRYRFMQNLPTAEEREELKELLKVMDNQIRVTHDAYKHFARRAEEIDQYLQKIEKSFDDRKREIDLLLLRVDKKLNQADTAAKPRTEPAAPNPQRILDRDPWDPAQDGPPQNLGPGDKYDEAVRLAKEGFSRRDIAERVNLSESEVDVILSLKRPK